MQAQIICPHCYTRISYLPEVLGKTISCTHCFESFIVDEGAVEGRPAKSSYLLAEPSKPNPKPNSSGDFSSKLNAILGNQNDPKIPSEPQEKAFHNPPKEKKEKEDMEEGSSRSERRKSRDYDEEPSERRKSRVSDDKPSERRKSRAYEEEHSERPRVETSDVPPLGMILLGCLIIAATVGIAALILWPSGKPDPNAIVVAQNPPMMMPMNPVVEPPKIDPIVFPKINPVEIPKVEPLVPKVDPFAPKPDPFAPKADPFAPIPKQPNENKGVNPDPFPKVNPNPIPKVNPDPFPRVDPFPKVNPPDNPLGGEFRFAANTPRNTATRGLVYLDIVRVLPFTPGVRYELEDAPPGMMINNVGAVTWTAPRDFDKDMVSFTIKATSPQGKVITQKRSLRVQKGF